jgi:antitoxin (DNA-binding transcriptional repressor) of toxin-antitoxin stability system
MNEYGPVPVSRLKEESSRIFDALAKGRRVLISKHGEVVAIIHPSTDRRFTADVVKFAVDAPTPYTELGAAVLAQVSPSEYITAAARDGARSFVTRKGKVLGVLTGASDLPSADSQAGIARDEVEARLADYERAHPDATPEEFEAFSDSLFADQRLAATPEGGIAASAFDDWLFSNEELLDRRLLGLTVRSRALRARGEIKDAHEAAIGALEAWDRAWQASAVSPRRPETWMIVACLGNDLAAEDPELALAFSDRLLGARP